MRKHQLRKTLLAIHLGFSLLCASPAQSAELPPTAKQEISHLLDYLEKSGCEFNRNGSWYSAKDATAHLQSKYDYLLKKKLVGSAEDFIERAAKESSVSKKPYIVRCSTESSMQSESWFKAELGKYRSKGP